MPPLLTHYWQRRMTPHDPLRRREVAGWCIAAFGLLAWWCYSWVHQPGIQVIEHAIERALGAHTGQPAWWQEGDLPLHLLTALALLGMLHWAWRLFLPSWPWWSAVVMAVSIALADESLQALAPHRSVQWKDLATDAAALGFGLGLLWCCGQLSLPVSAHADADDAG